ncbi:putative dehydrogenase [Caldalkalibacillus uzonensis]|uniref:Dehydrogenase n=1 Tax=Caldalkalibacillus uzonensis TaxID=353224 RepID=A0ABU0CRP3_9BACI|nr:Gfo/Idh/MocA family oxidoreductase [Caldalkalibacillus uzonensis]MDQ0338817.1 putative dehydrogenase [Caldalkalibacillus uzonensis]
MEKFRIGIIGAGTITKLAHYTSLSALKDQAEVVAIADINEHQAVQLAEKYDTKHIFSGYRELLRLADVDAVLISLPNFLHAKVAIEAMEAGKHVLCEKPMAINGLEAQQMVEVQKKTGKVLMVGLNNRFRSDVQFIKEQVNKGELGEIYYAKCGWMRRAGIPGWGTWFTTKSKSGGGPLIDIGVHMLDVTLYLMGNPKPVSVVGATYIKFGHTKEGLNRVSWGDVNENGMFDVEDLATAFIRLDNGATLALEVSWAANIAKDDVYVQLLGNKSGIRLTNDTGLTIYTEREGFQHDITPHITYDDQQARINMWKHFLHCLETGETPLCSPEQGLLVNQILDAIYQSSETGRQVFINQEV